MFTRKWEFIEFFDARIKELEALPEDKKTRLVMITLALNKKLLAGVLRW